MTLPLARIGVLGNCPGLTAATLAGLPVRRVVARFDLACLDVDAIRQSDVLIASDPALDALEDAALCALTTAEHTELIVCARRATASRIVMCQAATGARLCSPEQVWQFLRANLTARVRPKVACRELASRWYQSDVLERLVAHFPYLSKPSVSSLRESLGGCQGAVDRHALHRLCLRAVGAPPAELLRVWKQLAMTKARARGATWHEIASLFGYGTAADAHFGFGRRGEPRPARGREPWILEPPAPAPPRLTV